MSFQMASRIFPSMEPVAIKLLQTLDPETAHALALLLLKFGVGYPRQITTYDKLQTRLAGIDLENPLGLAAGVDKNAFLLQSIFKMGFGFVEVGGVTVKPQKGNSKPRVFRVKGKDAIINHLGFNNIGMEKVNKRLKTFGKRNVVGLNIGVNRDSVDRVSDYNKVLEACGNNLHFATINVSSPNTKKLRELQQSAFLDDLLSSIKETNTNLNKKIKIFLKISPDLEYSNLEKIVRLCDIHNISGIIATNTTAEIRKTISSSITEKGGLSGKPLFLKSTKIVARIAVITEGKLPLIGVGGIASGKDAFTKISAGATAIQLYTALTYQGPSLVFKILTELNDILEKLGFNNIEEAVGISKEKFL